MPLGKNIRYLFGKTYGNERKRFAFRGSKVVEVQSFRKRNGIWVKKHRRRT